MQFSVKMFSPSNFFQLFHCFKGRPLSVQQQMMQQSRQLDPNLLVKQQTPPSQQQPLHQPAMKSFLDNVMPHTTPELQKGPSPINAFSNFPIGGFLLGPSIGLMLRYHRHASFTRSLTALFLHESYIDLLAVPSQRVAIPSPSFNLLHVQGRSLSSRKSQFFFSFLFFFFFFFRTVSCSVTQGGVQW